MDLLNYTCCRTEDADQTYYLTQSQYTGTGPNSPCSYPMSPGTWQHSYWSTNSEVTWMTWQGKSPMGKAGIEPRSAVLEAHTLPVGQQGSEGDKDRDEVHVDKQEANQQHHQPDIDLVLTREEKKETLQKQMEVDSIAVLKSQGVSRTETERKALADKCCWWPMLLLEHHLGGLAVRLLSWEYRHQDHLLFFPAVTPKTKVLVR